MVKPGGTGKPAEVISAKPAPLPPKINFRSFPWGPTPCLGLSVAEEKHTLDGLGGGLGLGGGFLPGPWKVAWAWSFLLVLIVIVRDGA